MAIWKAQNAFTGGEISPRLFGRVDLSQYGNSVAGMTNAMAFPQGGARKRPGTKYGWTVKDSSASTRVLPFAFSKTQTYVLEMGNLYIRFGKNGSQIESGGSPVEVVTPYTTAQIFDVKTVQSADVMWFFHPEHPPYTLSRTSDTSWTMAEEAWIDGPYFLQNNTATTITSSGATGAVTLTASAITGINDGTGFQSTDVGRHIRIYDHTVGTPVWSWAKITGYTSTTVVSATIQEGTFPTVATAVWRLGKWSDTTGFPSVGVFHQDRLVTAGVPAAPGDIDMTASGIYNEFQIPSTITDASPVSFTLLASEVNAVVWLKSTSKALGIGTVGGEWSMSGGAPGVAITPTNVIAYRHTTNGGADKDAVQSSNAILYISRTKKKLREYAYIFSDDAWRSPDLSILSEHLFRGKTMVEVAHQKSADIIWIPRSDGTLLGLTYSRENEVVGWHKHTSGASASFESVCVVFEDAGAEAYDVPYFVVSRTINGGTVRYVEYLADDFPGDDVEDAYFVDCGITYDGSAITTITGLDHLEGEAVDVLADGIVVTGKTVSSGAITLDVAASKVHVGLNLQMDLETLPIEFPQESMGRIKSVAKCVLKFNDAYGGQAGGSIDELTEIIFNEGLVHGAAPELFNGEKQIRIGEGYKTDQRIFYRSDKPLPVAVSALIVDFNITED